MNHNIEITDIKIVLAKNEGNFKANTKANVTIVLNDALVLKGLKIIKGEFGHSLAFPTIWDLCSTSLRKHMQHEVLQRYCQVLDHTTTTNQQEDQA